MRFRNEIGLKPYIHLKIERRATVKNKKRLRTLCTTFSPVNLRRCKKRKRMATTRTAEQFVKVHSKISYNGDKRYGREYGSR